MEDTRCRSRIILEGGLLRWFDPMDSWGCVPGRDAYYRPRGSFVRSRGEGVAVEQGVEGSFCEGKEGE